MDTAGHKSSGWISLKNNIFRNKLNYTFISYRVKHEQFGYSGYLKSHGTAIKKITFLAASLNADYSFIRMVVVRLTQASLQMQLKI